MSESERARAREREWIVTKEREKTLLTCKNSSERETFCELMSFYLVIFENISQPKGN